MIYTYFEKRKELRFVTVLVDSRHDPMPIDLSLIEWLENHEINYLIVLTKCDKFLKALIPQRVEQWKHLTENCNHVIDVLPTSSENGMGRDAFLAILKKHL
jgi:GTP-binding protein